MKSTTTPQRVTLKELEKRSGYSRQTITTWTTAGILQRRNGLYDLVASLEAIKRRETDRATDGGHDIAELRGLKRQLLEKKLEKLTFELSVARGLVHSEADCCQSLTAIRAVESRLLWNLGSRVAAQLPEAGPRLVQICDSEVDDILKHLHDGSAYTAVRFQCPHCHQPVEQLEAVEPTTEENK